MSMTITETTSESVKKIKAAWTSDGSGNASGTTVQTYNGEVLKLVTVPGAGDAAPNDNYGVTAVDADSVDVLHGAGANRDTANTEYVDKASLGCAGTSQLTIAVAGAGATNTGTIYLWIR